MNTSSRLLTDIYREALSKCNIFEEAFPNVRGNLIKRTEAYNKTQRLLRCPQMEPSHPYLYGLNFIDLGDEDSDKIDSLYDLAISEGYIDDTAEQDNYLNDAEQPDIPDTTSDLEPNTELSKQPVVDASMPKYAAKDKSYTCFYSAIKEGDLRTGECYITGISTEEAKTAAISSLTKLGFSEINIIAIEECNDDVVTNTPVSTITYPTDEQPTDMPVEAEAPVKLREAEDDEVETIDEEPEPEEVEVEEPEEDTAEPADDSGEETDGEENEVNDDGADAESEPEEDTAADEELDDGADEEKSTDDTKSTSDKTDEIINPDEESDNTEIDDDAATVKTDITTTDGLSHTEKLDLFASYFRLFKRTLEKLDSRSYKTLPLKDRAKFWNILSLTWDKNKPDPMEFMSASNIEKLENYTLPDPNKPAEEGDAE